MQGLSMQEIMKIVNRYIGVSGGYLGDFSYRTHADFYLEYCNLDKNPYNLEGTTRERFIEILKTSTSGEQAKIIRGVLEKFPINDVDKPATRTQELREELIGFAIKIERSSLVNSPNLEISSEVVHRAISDAEILLKNNDAISAIDRIHTALHGYLMSICDIENIAYQKDYSMTKLFKTLRQNHPKLLLLVQRQNEIERILQSFSSILDALNPIRNNASIAHPNKNLLEKDEAMLVVNIAKTIMQYLDSKFGSTN